MLGESADPNVFNLDESSVRKNYTGGNYTSLENVRTENVDISTSYPNSIYGSP